MSLSSQSNMVSIFFFQAEDGIRDRTVTGVQTCALPILQWNLNQAFPGLGTVNSRRPYQGFGNFTGGFISRSEERRVGKEGRYRGGGEPCKKKKDTRIAA